MVQRVEIITGKERRRRWSEDEKRRLVAESHEPGSGVARVARCHGVAESCLYVWRKQFAGDGVAPSVDPPRLIPVRVGAAPGSIAVLASPPPTPTPPPTPPSIGTAAPRARTVVTLGDGTRLEAEAGYPVAALKALIGALRRRR